MLKRAFFSLAIGAQPAVLCLLGGADLTQPGFWPLVAYGYGVLGFGLVWSWPGWKR